MVVVLLVIILLLVFAPAIPMFPVALVYGLGHDAGHIDWSTVGLWAFAVLFALRVLVTAIEALAARWRA
jgi:hypothetical protein